MDPELKALLAAFGFDTVASASAGAQKIDAFLARCQAAVGTRDLEAVLERITALAKFRSDVEAIAGKTGDAALGALAGLKEASTQLATATAKVTAMETAAKDAEVKALLDEATKAGRLQPASREKAEKVYALSGLEGVKAFVDALPVGRTPSPQTPPRQPTQGEVAVAITDADRAVAKAMGLHDPNEIATARAAVAKLEVNSQGHHLITEPKKTTAAAA